jgi:hypothetical protein
MVPLLLGPKVNEKLHFMHGIKSLALDISRSFLNKILKKEPVELNEKSVNKCKDSLDSFDKDLIRRVVVFRNDKSLSFINGNFSGV